MNLYNAIIISVSLLILLYHHLTPNVIPKPPKCLTFSIDEVKGENMLKFRVTLKWIPSVSPTVTNQIIDITKGRPYVPEELLTPKLNIFVFDVDENTEVEGSVVATNGTHESIPLKFSFKTPSFSEYSIPSAPTSITHSFEVVDV